MMSESETKKVREEAVVRNRRLHPSKDGEEDRETDRKQRDTRSERKRDVDGIQQSVTNIFILLWERR